MALSGDGLFSRAKNAADKYKKAQEDEVKLISDIGKEMYSEYVGAFITGYEPTNGEYTVTKEQSGLEMTDTVDDINRKIENIDEEKNQTFTTIAEGELKWRIWDYDGTTLRIILDRPTTQKLTLKGATGYNNGVYLINEICKKCFGNEEMKGISVANLKRSDIQKVSTYDYTTYSHNDDGYEEVEDGKGTIKFGDTKTYSENNKYPEMWGKNDKNWTNKSSEDKKCLIWEIEKLEEELKEDLKEDATAEFKESYYSHKFRVDEFENKNYYDMIFMDGVNGDTKETYYLAGRYVALRSERCNFGIQLVGSKKGGCRIHGNNVLYSSGEEHIPMYGMRPLISINLEKNGYRLKKIIENDSVSYELEKF